MKKLISITPVVLILVISCGKASRSLSVAKMQPLVKVGMPKEEVIKAIGKPDRNTLEESESRARANPGSFVFFYSDGSNELGVSFKNGAVYHIDMIDLSLPVK